MPPGQSPPMARSTTTRPPAARSYSADTAQGSAGRPGAPLVGLAARAAALACLVAGLPAFGEWAGRAVLAPGPWLATDELWYRALNGIALVPLSAALFVMLNDPGLDYFALIVVLLAYCAWRKPAYVPTAALAVGVALALNARVTEEIHHAGVRPRPFAHIAEARTPVMSCQGVALVAMRRADEPVASCGDGTAGAAEPATGATQGVDWRDIWTQFPSFPSGHMRETAALCVLLMAFWRASWPFALAALAVLGFSRVHLGAHYPTDVLGGAVVGLGSGLVTVVGLDLLRHLAVVLYRVPSVARLWDWVYRSRVAGQPHLDPWPARLIRVAALVGVVHITLWGLGFASNSPRASHIYSVLQGVDERVFGQLTGRFDPALARPLYTGLGPAGLLYAVLALAALALALRRGRRSLVAALATLALGVALALELHWVGTRLFSRPQPFVQTPDAPVGPEWRALWAAASTFPNRHVLLAATLAGVLGVFGRHLVVAGQALALGAAVVALYFGAAWVADALAGYVVGNAAAIVARYAVAQVWASEAPATATAAPGREATQASGGARRPGAA